MLKSVISGLFSHFWAVKACKSYKVLGSIGLFSHIIYGLYIQLNGSVWPAARYESSTRRIHGGHCKIGEARISTTI
jgi:hypothetical protein